MITVNEEGRYEVELPWIMDHVPLPDNRKNAEKSLERVVKKLKEENLFDAYDNVFKEWLQEGIIEEVPEDEESCIGHFLPHRPVFKEEGTTKTRPVFQAMC